MIEVNTPFQPSLAWVMQLDLNDICIATVSKVPRTLSSSAGNSTILLIISSRKSGSKLESETFYWTRAQSNTFLN